MKPLTRYAMGTGMNIEPHMAPWPEGPYYRVDKVDAVIRELEAERDAARADAERLRAAIVGLLDQEPEHCPCGDEGCSLHRRPWDAAHAAIAAAKSKA